jgi:hypothetical protein
MLLLTRANIWSFEAIDLGNLVANETAGQALMSQRGRAGWLERIHDRLRVVDLDIFNSPVREHSAYQRTDRHGRRTFSNEFAASFMPVSLPIQAPDKSLAGVLEWWFAGIRIGATGSFSVLLCAQLHEMLKEVSVKELVRSFHGMRLAVRAEEILILRKFVRVWNSAILDIPLEAEQVPSQIDCAAIYEVVDVDHLVGGTVMAPKHLYVGDEVGALRDLAGLTRMSLVMDQYDEAGVRRLANHDLGNRTDEMWIVNEARLVRHHPEVAANAYVRAFFDDVLTGLDALTQQAATLSFISKWLRQARAGFLDGLFEGDPRCESFETMQRLLREMAGARELFADPITLQESSGHSFFRTLMSKVSAKLNIDQRRAEVRGSFDSLLQVAQAIAAQETVKNEVGLQKLSIEIAESSRRVTRNAYIIAIAAAMLALVQIVLAIIPTFRPEPPGLSRTPPTPSRASSSPSP